MGRNQNFIQLASDRLTPVVILVGLIWAIEVVNFALGHRLNQFGIIPRTASGLIGIPIAPLLHVSLSHTLLNTVPLIVLGAMVAAYGPRSFFKVSVAVALVGGLGVWLFARTGAHVGASGLIFGFFGYVIARALFERKVFGIVLACLAFFLFGGIIYGVLPTSAGISWEAHLLGLLAGAGLARQERKVAHR